VELALELVASAKNSVEFRTALPPGFASRDEVKRELKDRLPEVVAKMAAASDSASIVDFFAERVKAGRPVRPSAFRADVTVIGLDAPLKAPEPSRYHLSQDNGSITLEFDGKRIVLPGYVRTTLDALCSRPVFAGRDLPPDLDDDSKLVLLRYLQLEGFVQSVA